MNDADFQYVDKRLAKAQNQLAKAALRMRECGATGTVESDTNPEGMRCPDVAALAVGVTNARIQLVPLIGSRVTTR